MEQKVNQSKIHNYLMQPGDGTMYRFSIQACEQDDYVLGTNASFVMIYINMPGGVGLGYVHKKSLELFLDNPDLLFGYLKGHGFSQVHDYTLAAVLLAASVFVNCPRDILAAAERMLDAPNVLAKIG